LRPLPQRLVRSPQFAFLDDLAVGGLDAVADAFLVNVESDIVFDVHWVLLIEVSEPVRKDRSRHYTLQGNPTAAPYLYIQTDSQFPANCAGNSLSVPGLRRSPATIQSAMASGPRELLEHRIVELSTELELLFESAREQARREQAEELNQAVRRLR